MQKRRWILFSCFLLVVAQLPGLGGFNQNLESEINKLWDPPYSLSGAGYIIAMWEPVSPYPFHPEYQDRITFVQQNSNNAIATHAAGILVAAGVAPSGVSRGVAYQADLHVWDTEDFELEYVDAVFDGAVVGSHSWGAFLGYWYDPNPSGFLGPGWRDQGGEQFFGAYVLESQASDTGVRDADLDGDTFLVFFGAGDDRNEGPGQFASSHDGTPYPEYDHVNPYFDCIDPFATGKNVITVGATDLWPNTRNVTQYSSWGPTDEGRIKPDIVARGHRVYSSTIGGGGLYGNADGTDRAAPAVAATSVLLMEYYERLYGHLPTSSEVKSLLLNTAEDRGPEGPDYLYGFGFLDAKIAANQILFDGGTESLFKHGSIDDAQITSYSILVTEDDPIRVTLSWMDPPGPATINDLDLRLNAPGGGIHYPYRLNPSYPPDLAVNDGPNPIDTVEQIIVDDPDPGLWTLEVRGTTVLLGPQRFGVVSSHPLNGGAPEPTGLDFTLNPDGNSIDIAWNAVADLDLVEHRVHRTNQFGQVVDLIAIVPAGTNTYTDVAPPADPLLGYDVRAIYDRNGATMLSERPTAFQTAAPVMLVPEDGATEGSTVVVFYGKAEPFSTVALYENINTPTLIQSGISTGPDGVFVGFYVFGGAGSYNVFAQSVAYDGQGISAPSVEIEFTIP